MSRRLKSAESEFETLADRSTDDFARQFVSMLRAVVRGDGRQIANARERLAAVFAQTMTLADMVGRRRALLEFDFAMRGEARDVFGFGVPSAWLTTTTPTGATVPVFAVSPVVPNVPFATALADIVSREPRLAGTAQEVADLYRTRHAFALARSSEQRITSAVQAFIGRSIQAGTPLATNANIISAMGDFTRSYASMSYRTNLNTAYTAGRMEQAKEPAIRVALPAFERFSVTDSALRSGRPQDGPKGGVKENHRAAVGLVMDTADPRWRLYAPPSSYNCRCGLRMVPVGEMKRRGLIEKGRVIPFLPPGLSSFRPHPNFGVKRPDFEIYGG